MGTVLPFQPRREPASRPPIALSTPPSVVIFPGVRYERYAAADAKTPLLALEAKPQVPSKPTN